MKPTAYKYESPRVCTSFHEENTNAAGFKITPLYTAHEIANFVKGLYFDDDFPVGTGKSVFAEIADKIEKESEK